MKINKKLILLVIFGFIIFFVTVETHAAGMSRGEGIMTSIEDDGTVLIDNKGYDLDAKVQVFDLDGKSISLNKLKLPKRVSFKYEYMQKGFVIKSLKEQPDELRK